MNTEQKAIQLMDKAICLLESGKSFQECYPVLREIEPLLTECFGASSWPRLLVKWRDDEQGYEVATSVSGVDNYLSGFITTKDLTEASNEEWKLLIGEILLALKQWKIDIAADTTDTKTDTEKNSGKKRQLSSAGGSCAIYVRDTRKDDPTADRMQAVKDWAESKHGEWEGKKISVKSIYRQLTDNPESWKSE